MWIKRADRVAPPAQPAAGPRHLGISTVNAGQVAEAQSIAPVVWVRSFHNIAGAGVPAV